MGMMLEGNWALKHCSAAYWREMFYTVFVSPWSVRAAASTRKG
jgi:hypothetical protein